MKEVHWYCCTKLNLTMQEMMFIEMKEINNMINVTNHIHQKHCTIDIQDEEENDSLQMQSGTQF